MSITDNSKLIYAWKTGKYYPNLYLPQSPCISLQWTYRDNKRINLPSVLLAKGDVISLCPGHPAPGHCCDIKSSEFTGSTANMELQAGDIFSPSLDHESSAFVSPRLRKAVKPIKFMMLETPFIANLKLVLERSWKRPATLYEKERHIFIAKYSEQILIPVIWIIAFLADFLPYKYFETNINFKVWSQSSYLLLLRPSLCLLPLLPLTLPCTWLLVNVYGAAHLFNLIKSRPMITDPLNTTNLNLNSPGSAISAFNLKSKKNFKENYFDDFETNSSGDVVSPFTMTWREVFKSVFSLIFCKDGNVWRSANFLHVFGSITALCCVDKKGILSWPNPAADKVFFLNSNRDKSTCVHDYHVSATIESLQDADMIDKSITNNDYFNKRGPKNKKAKYCKLTSLFLKI
jgi:PREDICTED: similar to lethal (2) k05819 CG3054-PA